MCMEKKVRDRLGPVCIDKIWYSPYHASSNSTILRGHKNNSGNICVIFLGFC